MTTAAPGAASTITQSGRVVRTRYADTDSGFSVVSVDVAGKVQTWVGDMPTLRDGAEVRATGTMERHERFGAQFQVTTCVPSIPVSEDGILSYLAGGVLPGVGPVMARRLVERFGAGTFAALGDVAMLQQVDGIGPKIATGIAEAWQTERETAEVLARLAGYGVSGSVAAKVVARYRSRAVEMVERDPYRLAMEVRDVGFATADRIAAGVGITLTDPARMQGVLVQALHDATGQGHCYLPLRRLLAVAAELARKPRQDGEKPIDGDLGTYLLAALDDAIEVNRVVAEVLPDGTRIVYPRPHYEAECAVAERLLVLRDAGKDAALPGAEAAVAAFEADAGMTLAPEQREAVAMAARSRVMVVTGGPGVGKSQVVKAILGVLRGAGLTVALASPTGRAAKRLAEATGREASTIHRLLEFHPRFGFMRNEHNPIPASAVIVDEASMVDAFLMRSLLSAIATGARLILVGDVDQLPSVGPGAVLRDVIDSGAVPVARLTRIFRQAKGSTISVAAASINRGERPQSDTWPDPRGEFFTRAVQDSHAPGRVARDMIVDLVSREIPERFGIPASDIQVLTPMRKGDAGAIELNRHLAARLNGRGPSLKRGVVEFRVGDRALVTKNDYDMGCWNGDQGRVVAIDEAAKSVTVEIDGKRVVFTGEKLATLLLGYACTVHRSQGSEYPCVVVCVQRDAWMLLSRNLVYTAVTRGRRLVVLVADPAALRTALSETRRERRNTRLAERLRGG